MTQQSVESEEIITPQAMRDKLIEKVLEACAEPGAKKAKVARKFGIDRTTIYRWLKEKVA